MAGILNLQLKLLLGDKKTNLKKVEHYIKFNSDKRFSVVWLSKLLSCSFLLMIDFPSMDSVYFLYPCYM